MNNYENRDNRNRNESNDSNGTQLFVAKGRNHGMTPESLIDFIANETSIDPTGIKNPKVLDDFSFITVPHADADIVLDHFQAKAGEDSRPLVSKAKRKTEGGGRSGGGFGDRRPRESTGFGGGFRSGDRDGRDNRDNRDRRGGGGFGGNRERDGNRSDDRRGNSSGGYSNKPRRDDY